MPIKIVNQDITQIKCDAVVCPTDRFFSGGGGVDELIHRRAGLKLDECCEKLVPLNISEAKMTPAFNMQCRTIIHVCGPRWINCNDADCALLRCSYLNALMCAGQIKARRVAFPLISSGEKGFPKNLVIGIALMAVSDYLASINGDMTVYICIYDREAIEVSNESKLRGLINRVVKESGGEVKPAATVEQAVQTSGKSFRDSLFEMMDRKEIDAVQCYKKANVTKGTFSKIKNDPGYRPSRETALAFAVALGLDINETNALLETTGYTLSKSSVFDNIVRFYIENGVYDIGEINAALFKFDQKNFLGY